LNQNKITYLILPLVYLLGITTICYRLFGDILFKLNDTQLDRSGDGFKNYFAFAWQYKHEKGLWFEGMQYPYGDLLTYADGQPAILLPLIGLKKLGLDFSGHELFVIQLLPILAFFLGAYFLHKIIRAYKVPQWWTVISVLGCMALSPQLYRFNAHFALAYIFCFPSIWYALLLLEKKKLNSYSFIPIVGILLLVYAYIHPYHLLIGSIFLLAYFFIKLFRKEIMWAVLAAGLLPIIIYLILNNVVDPYMDRPQNPWGSWHYKTEIGDLFPFYGWYAGIMDGFISIRSSYNEGYAYLGILFFGAPFLLYKNWKSKKESNQGDLDFSDFIWAALLVLVFSMGIHILITNHKILDWVSALKQFRALGRFAWPFYYIGFIGLSVLFYRWTIQLKSKPLQYFIISMVIIMWALDGNFYMRHFNKNMKQYKAPNELYSNLHVAQVLDKANLDIKQFQAIMPIPISMEGAEKVTPADNWFSKTQAIPFAFQSGLPMIGAYMSRTSLSRILKQYQLCSSNYIQKEILDDLESPKDLLIVIGNEDTLAYNDLIKQGYLIGHTKETMILGMPISVLKQTSKINIDSLEFSERPLYYNNYSENQNQGLKSNGILEIDNFTQITNVQVDTLINQSLTLSFWFRIDENHSSVPKLNITIKDQKQNVVKSINYRDLDIHRCEVLNNWIQLKRDIIIPENAFLLDWNIDAENLSIDHPLITKSENVFWHKLNESYIIYDHYIAETIN